MRRKKIVFAMTAALLLYGTAALAEQPSVALGMQLFNNPGLGASQNAISCTTCHPDGKGMEKAASNANLTEMINQCIAGPLKGEPLSAESVAMQSLELYLNSLAK